MKRFYQLVIFMLIGLLELNAQAPNLISFQAVVRNDEGALITNSTIKIRVSVIQGQITNNPVYMENHAAITNLNGLFTIEIGAGEVQFGTFNEIDWSNSPYYVRTEIDPSGGSDFSITNTTQLLSVPYALYAERSGSSGEVGPQGPQGENGISILWLGSFADFPSDATLNNAFYNTSTKKSYVYDGTSWQILAQDGDQGIQGEKGDKGDPGIGFTYRGDWVTGTNYFISDYVFATSTEFPEENSMYIAKNNFLSEIEPKSDLTNWVEFQAPQGPIGPEGPEGNSIVPAGDAGQVLVHNGTQWAASSTVNTSNNYTQVIPQDNSDPEKPIFEVKNSSGKVVFAVYESGVKFYVANEVDNPKSGFSVATLSEDPTNSRELLVVSPDSTRVYFDDNSASQSSGFAVAAFNDQKYLTVEQSGTEILYDNSVAIKSGSKGGFAVGGLTQSKGTSEEYLRVTRDSSRIFVNTDIAKSGSKGGFAVGGLTQSKSANSDYLFVSPDSIRMYIEDGTGKSGSKGGFAVGGLTQSKGTSEEYLRVTRDSSRIFVNTDIAKSGSKGGFAVGGLTQSKSANSDYLFVSPDSTRIYIEDEGLKGSKSGSKGGFAVGGLTQSKGGPIDLLRVTLDSTNIFFNTIASAETGGFAVRGLNQLSESVNILKVKTDTTNVLNILASISDIDVGGTVLTTPIVVTVNDLLLSTDMARVYGQVIDDNGFEVTERGICWGTNPEPTYGVDNVTTNGTGIGTYTAILSGLVDGETYYYRAYAINSKGISYGEELSFAYIVANLEVPILVLHTVVGVTPPPGPWELSVSGELIDEGSSKVTQLGFCYSTTNETPTILDSYTTEDIESKLIQSVFGPFPEGVTVYFRPYAINSAGVGYGEVGSASR